MKKIIYLNFIFLLFFGNNVCSQIPFSNYIDSTSEWHLFYIALYYDSNCNSIIEMNSHINRFISGDTSINGISYHKMYTTRVDSYYTCPTPISYTHTYYEIAIREDSLKKIYINYGSGINEELLYDFNSMSIGDTVDSFYPIISIDTFIFGSTSLKKYNLGCAFPPEINDKIIEGIGAVSEFLSPYYCGPRIHDNTTLICYTKQSNILIVDSTRICDINSVITLNKKELNSNSILLNIYPNPFENIVTISLENIDQEYFTLLIVNSLGKIVFSKEINISKETINLELLPSGLYYVHLKNKEKISSTKIIKK